MDNWNNSIGFVNLWNIKFSWDNMNPEFLGLFANVINFTIFLYLTINLIGTSCFSAGQMSLVAFGLFASIIAQIVAVILRRF